MARGMTVEDKRWQAEEDARTLARAEEIKASKSRSAAAVREAKRLVREAEKNLNHTKKAAGNPRRKGGKKK